MRVSLPGKMRFGPVLTSTVIMAAIVVVAVLLGAGSPARARRLPAARPFTLSQLGIPGRKISLAAYAGRPVIINFFASWCAPCQKETPLIARFYTAHHGRVVIIGIHAHDQPGAA
ncbi:MAG: TlpA disulfide reductase family protein, partial [Actinomycetota bacterium]|nr:TlpA disulfide reductase family protein [Actinomycetota bacterium]